MTPTAQAYAELQQAYDFFNERLFEARLPACLLTFQRERRSYGYFSHEAFVDSTTGKTTDEIALNCAYFATVPLIEILQTLAHEMVHLWQFRFGKPSRKGYHNKEFAAKMKAIGLMPSSTGMPGGEEVGQHMADYVIPGGPFLAACKTLLETSFRITWMDRHPIQPQHNPTPEILKDDPAAEELVTLGAFSMPAESLVASVTRPAGTFDSPGGAGEVGALTPVTDRSNRLKFTCEKCGDNIWGKPSLANVKHGGECGDAAFVRA
jgi:hypothetical protein